jgi:hypothetical protein
MTAWIAGALFWRRGGRHCPALSAVLAAKNNMRRHDNVGRTKRNFNGDWQINRDGRFFAALD